MTDADIAELEAAARVFMDPTCVIQPEQRQNAEKIILNFRKTKSPYLVCQQILEKSSVDMLLFEAADVIKRALIIEWDGIQDQDRLGLRQYLMNYVLQRHLQPFIREKILQVIAIMIKRNSVTDAGLEAGNLLKEMEKMLAVGEIEQKLLVCRIITAILQEYLITVKSDDSGLTFSEHFKAKKAFEVRYMVTIFKMALTAIEELMNVFDIQNAGHNHLLLELLNIEEQILMWGYVSPLLPKRLIGLFESLTKTDQTPSLRLGVQWATVILNPKVIDLFFGVYWKVREIPELQRKNLTCIVQLSTLNGAVFRDSQSKLDFITNYLSKFLQFLSCVQVKENEALGFATIFRKALLYHPPNKNLPPNIVSSMLQHMFNLTGTFCEASVHEDSKSSDDSTYNEALEKILEAWLLILQGKEHFPREVIHEYSLQIFNKYVQCHLSAPEGLRTNSEFDEDDECDREKYKEQLIIVGNLARESPGHSLTILSKLIEERTRQLQAQFQAMYTNGNQLNMSIEKAMEILFEDIHWLILVAGHVVAMESSGEQPMIPSEIMQYSVDQLANGTVDVTTTLKVLAAPNQCITQTPNAENVCDPLIRLISSVFRLCDIENNAIEYKMGDFLSPEVTSDIMWFLNQWSEAYLFMLTEYYPNLSETLQTSFGLDTPGGNWTLNFILNKICINVRSFATEETIVKDSVGLFVSLVKRKHKCPAVFNSEPFKQIVQLKNLPLQNSELIKGLVITAACVTEKEMQKQYLSEILMPITESFNKLEWQQAMDNNHQIGKTQISMNVVALLENIRSSNNGASASCAQTVYEIFEPILYHLAELLDLFHNYNYVVVEIFQVLCSVVQNLSFLQSHKVYEMCMSCIRNYVKHNNRVTSEVTAEDESMEDLMLLLNLLNALLSKNYFDVGNEDEQEQATEVCILGLQYIIPMITLDMLKHPTLCCKYYKTITFFVETKSQKVCALQPELLNSMLQSVELGLRSFGLEVQSICFEFLHIIADTVRFDQNSPQSYLYNSLMPFMRMVLEMIINQEVGTDNKTECANALFALIFCYHTHYGAIVQNLLQSVQDVGNAERLSKELASLTANWDLTRSIDRMVQNQFADRYEKFIVNISFMYN
ncbi:exportin-4-like [Contarinia nasturtii]|uniref:exportin-4-like n=1 Tax=Contarinia nasturtii TaxID=265458 RepID=UPI0012D42300|nr:exportin-4-like [Contarinia nasturtii]XP_031622474.1 exportin-4-like [Contarinia nasturtii]XP_031622475.1 exportin-4-like [Contarinia nasturtii]